MAILVAWKSICGTCCSAGSMVATAAIDGVGVCRLERSKLRVQVGVGGIGVHVNVQVGVGGNGVGVGKNVDVGNGVLVGGKGVAVGIGVRVGVGSNGVTTVDPLAMTLKPFVLVEVMTKLLLMVFATVCGPSTDCTPMVERNALSITILAVGASVYVKLVWIAGVVEENWWLVNGTLPVLVSVKQ